MSYKITFHPKFRVQGEVLRNFAGTVVVFQDGVGYTEDEDAASYASRMRYISSVEEMSSEPEEPTPEPEEPTPEPEEPTPEYTKEELSALYEEHQTWTAVAEHLDISTATLKKYREEVGL